MQLPAVQEGQAKPEAVLLRQQHGSWERTRSAAVARPNQLQKKSPTGSLPAAVPLVITRTFRPWTHTSDDSYIYQLSHVVATATVSFLQINSKSRHLGTPTHGPTLVGLEGYH